MTLEPGREIARYRLLDKIGQGGMGVVWRARDMRLDRDVALKTLAPGLVGDESRRQRFIREAKAAAAVSHPNIAAIHDIGEEEGVVYLSMELVEGRTLRSLISETPLSVDRILALGAQIAEGLGRAHREGIVHRDIKPENVIVDDSGHAKILDFGLAKLRGAREADQVENAERETLDALTQEGQTVGTVPYMSPEQARGKTTDGRSDLFSLGVVLYEMVTGRLPFKGETSMDTLSAILSEAPVPPSSLNPKAGLLLSDLINKCLQKDPARRYQSAGDLAVDLRRLAGATGSYAQPVAGSRPPRKRSMFRAIGAAAVIGAAALAASLWIDRREGAPEEPSSKPASPPAAEAPIRIRSLAVIPLDDHSPGGDQGYFADGMTEALITEIAQLADLRVISRTSVMGYRENRPPLPVIAGELGVDAIVEGSVLKAEGRIRITAQLIHAADDRHLWAGMYERDHKDVLRLQGEVAMAIAGEIEGALRHGRTMDDRARRSVDPEAHDLLLRGQQNLDAGTEQSIRSSLGQFQSALEIDPGYAVAWVRIAQAYALLANKYLEPREAMPKAKAAVLRALDIDSDLAEAYATLAQIQDQFEWNFGEAQRSTRRALEINPSLAEAVVFSGWDELRAGRKEKGIELIKKALALDPLSVRVASQATWALFIGRDHEGALAVADDVLTRYPSHAGTYSHRAVILEAMGRKEDSLAAAERTVELDEAVWSLAFLARAQAIAGREEAARATLARLEETPANMYQCPFETALSWAALREYEQAQKLFEQAIDERAICWATGDLDARADSLQEFSWFRDLVERRTPMGPEDPDYVPLR